MTTSLIIIAAICLTLLIFFLTLQNQLVTKKNSIKNAKSSLDAYFLKRQDLIPNLLILLKQYMGHEKEILEKLSELRSTPQKEIKEESATVRNILLQVENYPDLKANQQFSTLIYAWNDLEEQIAASRRYVTSSITSYNNCVLKFPNSVVASILNFKVEEYEKINEEQKQRIDVSEFL